MTCRIKSVNGKKFRIYLTDVFIGGILVLVAGIRCNCGSDYYNYYVQYSNIRQWYDSIGEVLFSRFQSGFQDLCYLSSWLIGGQYTIFFVIEMLVAFPVLIYIRRHSKYFVEAFACWILLGYYAMSLNILKQIIAMVFILYAFDAITQKKILKFIVLAFVGSMFHISALFVIIALFFVDKIKYTRNFFWGVTLISIVMVLLFDRILGVFSKILPSRYLGYIEIALGRDADLKLQLGGILVSAVYIFLIYFICESNMPYDKYKEKMLKVLIISIPILCFGARYYLINRIAYYMVQFVIILLPDALRSVSRKKRKYIWSILFVYNISFAILCAENNYYNYSTIFNDQPMSVHDFIYR